MVIAITMEDFVTITATPPAEDTVRHLENGQAGTMAEEEEVQTTICILMVLAACLPSWVDIIILCMADMAELMMAIQASADLNRDPIMAAMVEAELVIDDTAMYVLPRMMPTCEDPCPWAVREEEEYHSDTRVAEVAEVAATMVILRNSSICNINDSCSNSSNNNNRLIIPLGPVLPRKAFIAVVQWVVAMVVAVIAIPPFPVLVALAW
jgi:hypothetical protein